MSTAAPDAWSDTVSAIRAAAPAAALAVHSRAARTIGRLLRESALPPDVPRVRVALLRSVMCDPLAASLVALLADCGMAADVQLGQLGAIAQETLADDSFLYRESFDVCVVLALAEHVLPGHFDPSLALDSQAGGELMEQLARLSDRFRGLIVVCNLAQPAGLTAPKLQAQTPSAARYTVARWNQQLAEFAAPRANVVVADLEALAAEMGGAHFWSPRDMAASMQPFSAAALPATARLIAETCLLYRRTPLKCVVLDCDNTLWGGIVGEDGLTGIQIGETYPGWCFQQFQRQLDQLNRLGFLLALNSKNNEADVRAVFEQHPGMVLKMEQIAALRVNWQDKASNLQELAEELNIGLDSFVFIDDSDFELNLVRERLPQVRCLQTPSQPWLLPGLLPKLAVADRLAVTAEDRKKAAMYAQERQREVFKASAGDFTEYLRGLQIELTFETFDPDKHLARAAQLTQKTNQFNLTTRRYSEAELLALREQGAEIFLASLRDRFGEYGRIALGIITPTSAEACALHVFLMSCRVIGRGVEDSFVRLMMTRMAARGFRRMTAEFIPTAKNAVCREFLPKLPFVETGRSDDGAIGYVYDMSAGIAPPSDWLLVREG